jgi:hypothetical protein
LGDFGSDEVDVSVYDINGRLVKQDQVQSKGSGIVVSDLPEGRYILKVKSETGVYSAQFIKALK